MGKAPCGRRSLTVEGQCEIGSGPVGRFEGPQFQSVQRSGVQTAGRVEGALAFAERCQALRQSEIDRDQGLGFDRAAVDQIRLVAPLPDGAIRRLAQKQRAANQLEVLNGAVPGDECLQYDCALQACPDRLFRIAGQNLLQQKRRERSSDNSTGSSAARSEGVIRAATLRMVALCTGALQTFRNADSGSGRRLWLAHWLTFDLQRCGRRRRHRWCVLIGISNRRYPDTRTAPVGRHWIRATRPRPSGPRTLPLSHLSRAAIHGCGQALAPTSEQRWLRCRGCRVVR